MHTLYSYNQEYDIQCPDFSFCQKKVSFYLCWWYNSAGPSGPAKTATLLELKAATMMRGQINLRHTDRRMQELLTIQPIFISSQSFNTYATHDFHFFVFGAVT